MQNSPDDSAFFDFDEIDAQTLDTRPVLRVVSPLDAAQNAPAKKKFGAHAPQNEPAFRVSSRRGELVLPDVRRAGDAVNATVRSINHDRPKRPGAPQGVPTETLVDYLADWIGDGQYNGQSPLTLRGKTEAVGKLLWFLEREKLERCGPMEIKRFLNHVKNGHLEPGGRFGSSSTSAFKPVGERTIQLYFVYIKGFLGWLVDEQVSAHNPLAGVKQPRAKPPKIEPLSIEEVALLLLAIRKCKNRARNEAILYFLLDTGVRVAELCSVRAGDCDLARGVANVTGKGDKTRQVCFGRDTSSALKRYLGKHPRTESEALFYSERPGAIGGDGISPDGVRRLLQRLAGFASLSEKRVSPHTFRHTFATEWIKDGGSPKALQMLLGHEDMEMTYRYVTLAEADTLDQHRMHSPARKLRALGRKK